VILGILAGIVVVSGGRQSDEQRAEELVRRRRSRPIVTADEAYKGPRPGRTPTRRASWGLRACLKSNPTLYTDSDASRQHRPLTSCRYQLRHCHLIPSQPDSSETGGSVNGPAPTASASFAQTPPISHQTPKSGGLATPAITSDVISRRASPEPTRRPRLRVVHQPART